MNRILLLATAGLLVLVLAWTLPSCDKLVTETSTVTLYDSTLGLECKRCHDDDDNRYLRPIQQWENSRHASDDLLRSKVELNGVLMSTADCGARCHTHEGYLAYVANGTNSPQTSPNAIGCFTCHSPHTGDYGTWTDTTLRGYEATVYLFDFDTAYQHGSSNMCVHCHRAVEPPPDLEEDFDITLTAEWGPHFSPQANVLIGKGGYIFNDTTWMTDFVDVHTHDFVKDGCLGCHFGTGMGYHYGEHTFRLEDDVTGEPYLKNCNIAGCHSNLTSLYEFSDDSIAVMADSLETLLKIWGYLDSDDEAGVDFPVGEKLETPIAGILYNYLMYRQDGSDGVHNPGYFRKLLRHTLAQWEIVPPAARFVIDTAYGPADGCAPHTVRFIDSSLSNSSIIKRVWNFGDGDGDSTSVNPTHVYETRGTYTVILRVDDLSGRSDTVIAQGVSISGPEAAIEVDIDSGFAPLSVVFSDASTCVSDPGTTWSWDFGDDSTSDQQNPGEHIYNSAGQFTVTLTVSNFYGSDVDTVIINSLGPQAAFVSENGRYGFVPFTVQFSDQSLPSPDSMTSWYWHFGDTVGTDTASTEQNPTHTYTTRGEFTVMLRATSDYGTDSVIMTDYIKVFGPAALFSADVREGCAPHEVTFTNRSMGDSVIESYTWDFGDGDILSVTDTFPVTHTYDTVGSFTVSLTAYSATYGDDTETKSAYIEATGPTAFIGDLPDTVCAVQDTVRFIGSTDCELTALYYWHFGDHEKPDSISILDTASHVYDTPGQDTVTFAVTNDWGTDTVTQIIEVVGPSAAFSVEEASGCAPCTTIFTNNSLCVFDSILWYFGDDSISIEETPEHIYTTPGEYDVAAVVIKTEGGLRDSVLMPNFITVIGPEFSFVDPEEESCLGDSILFTLDPDCNIDSLDWTVKRFDGTVCTTWTQPYNETVFVIYSETGIIGVDVKASNQYGEFTLPETHWVTVAEPAIAMPYMLPNQTGLVDIIFKDSSTAATFWVWDFGDPTSGVNNSAEGEVVSHTFTSAGPYTVRLTVWNACAKAHSQEIEIEVTE